jgi:plasmid stabilization system protein ParE
MGYQVALSPSARRDLGDIVRYIIQFWHGARGTPEIV